MRKNEIDALVRAHHGRARPVASLHVLRQSRLGREDQAFLLANVGELGPSDLLRWRSRCEPGATDVVMHELARRALDDPTTFCHEVLAAPKLDIVEDEWRQLADLLRGRVPESVLAIVIERGGPRPVRPPPEVLFTPGVIASERIELNDADLDGGERIDFEAARTLPLHDLLAKRRAQKLDIDEATLLALALEQAETSDQDWSSLARDIPGSLRDAVLAKARFARSAAERANLLAWLDRYDVAPETLIPIALAGIGDQGLGFGVTAWLARHLMTRDAWAASGVSTFEAFIAKRAFADLVELVTITFSEAPRSAGEAPAGLLEAMQVAFAGALIPMARDGIQRRAPAEAMAPLSALACLDPNARLGDAVQELAKLDGLTDEIAELVAVNVNLLRRDGPPVSSLEGLIAGLHALADAV